LTGWLKATWYRFLGRHKLRSHEFQSALQYFQTSAEQDSSNPGTAIEIGWCFYKLNYYQAAIDSYERALQQQPDHASAHAYLALVLSKVQRPQEAIEELRRALRIDPELKNRAFFESCLGKWLSEQGRWKEAVGPLESTIKSEPKDASARYSLGFAYAQLRRFEEAVNEFQTSAKLHPNWPDTYFALGGQLCGAGTVR